MKLIRRIPLGVPRLGKSSPTELTQKEVTSPGKAKVPRVAASRPKRRRQETAKRAKPAADVKLHHQILVAIDRLQRALLAPPPKPAAKRKS